jgi:hypothetical protein
MTETFYFGRLNYTRNNNRDIDKDLLLKELLEYGNKFRPLKKSKYQYGIFSLEEIHDPNLGLVYTGELVKYQDLKEEPVVKENKISIEYIEDVILGRSRFYLLDKTHLIAYNPYGKIISPKAFCESFVGILVGADDTFDIDAEIFPVNYEYEFMSFLKSMRTLNILEINLMPSNPNSRDLWDEIDDRLRSMNVKRYKEEFVAKENQSLEIDERTVNKIIMAQDGYGKAKGKGTDQDGNQVEISTDSKESITKKSINKDLSLIEQLNAVRQVFERVIERFKK